MSEEVAAAPAEETGEKAKPCLILESPVEPAKRHIPNPPNGVARDLTIKVRGHVEQMSCS